ncbi:MAG: hypothetical protein U5P41_11220 [Gammaproteobacteria bacterium]|nr:hypothetical protein [Gammaproteobacteria bacterium]
MRCRAVLIEQYGAPEIQIEEGEFGPNLSTRLTTDQFLRVYEWTVAGEPLRFGIPSRTDGLVRMEIRDAGLSSAAGRSRTTGA